MGGSEGLPALSMERNLNSITRISNCSLVSTRSMWVCEWQHACAHLRSTKSIQARKTDATMLHSSMQRHETPYSVQTAAADISQAVLEGSSKSGESG